MAAESDNQAVSKGAQHNAHPAAPASGAQRGVGVAQVDAMLAHGNPTPGDVAAVIEQHPEDRAAIMQHLQGTRGNAFVQQVIASATKRESPGVPAAPDHAGANAGGDELSRYPHFRDAMERINAQARAQQIDTVKHAGVTDWVVDKTESAKETVESWYGWMRGIKQAQYIDPHVAMPPMTMYDDVDHAIAAADAAYQAHDPVLLHQRILQLEALAMQRDRRCVEYYDRKVSGAETALAVTETTALTAGTVAGFAAGGPAGGAAAAGLIKADIEGAEEHGRGEHLDWKKIGFSGVKEAASTLVFALVAGPLGDKVFQPALGRVLGPALTRSLGPAAAASIDRYVAGFLAGVGTSGLMAAVELEIDRMHGGVKMSEGQFVEAVVEQMVRGGVQQLFIDAITHGAIHIAGKAGAAAHEAAPVPGHETAPAAGAAHEATPAAAPETAPAPHEVSKTDLEHALQRPTAEELRDKAIKPDITGPLANADGKRIGAKMGPVPDGKIQLADGSLADGSHSGVSPEARALLDTLHAKHAELAGGPRKVVVDGGGPTGALTALSAFHMGHDVTIVEMRDQATLPVLWSNRPGSMDILTEIDPVLAQRVAAASGTVHFYEHVNTDGSRTSTKLDAPRAADGERATGDPRAIAGSPSSWQSQNKTEVNLMWDRLEELAAQEAEQAKAEGRPPRLHLMRGYEVKALPVDGDKRGIIVQKMEQRLVKTNADGTKDAKPYTPGDPVPDGYKIERTTDGVDVSLGTPDDLFVAEGAGSKTRAMAGSQSVAVGPSAQYIAGYFTGAPLRGEDGAHGGARTRDDTARDGSLLHNVASTGSQSEGTWALPEVDPALNLKDPKSIESYFGRPMTEKEATLTYYKQQVAKVLECSPSDIPDNAFEMGPAAFTLQSHVSGPAAPDATNVHLIGDARGNSHFLASLGKVTGTGTHQMAIRQYYQALAWGLNPDVATALLERRLDAGTRVWLKSGLQGMTGFKYDEPDAKTDAPSDAGKRDGT